jgi:hypothetical protein
LCSQTTRRDSVQVREREREREKALTSFFYISPKANVRAICNVGGSTKQSSEFIGHKGIGFKSVFKISDTPLVFSRGFRFGFDVLRERLGYIVPHWVSESELLALDTSSTFSTSPSPSSFVKSLLLQQPEDTHFVLPLKDNSEFDPLELFERVDHVLLFLRKIQDFSVSLQPSQGLLLRKFVVVSSDKNSESFKTLQVNVWEGDTLIRSSTTNYVIYRHVLEVPSSLQGDNGRGRTAEIVLGFPQQLTSKELAERRQTTYRKEEEREGEEEEEEDEYCFVYSYLPIRSYGFPFMIQADFLLVSNRQDIHKNKAWNKWLRDQIPFVFYSALQSTKTNKDNSK